MGQVHPFRRAAEMQVFGNGHETGERADVQDSLLMRTTYHRRQDYDWKIISIGGIFKGPNKGAGS
ncbi:hypothetical protein [Rhizobium laguerreae]|uniref:hypothetical protein n=1 Tax=Rhizobium laguerreae TaxID=1076926 RepID=UPI00195311C1|nr:hypothetical protein [Rhizobium laguerreae]